MRDRALVKAEARKLGYTIYQDVHHRPPKYSWPYHNGKIRTYRYLSIVGRLSQAFIDLFDKEFLDARLSYAHDGHPHRITASLPPEDFEK